jgi:hypothetical protein
MVVLWVLCHADVPGLLPENPRHILGTGEGEIATLCRFANQAADQVHTQGARVAICLNRYGYKCLAGLQMRSPCAWQSWLRHCEQSPLLGVGLQTSCRWRHCTWSGGP